MEAGEMSFVLTDWDGNRLQSWDTSLYQKGKVERRLSNGGNISPGMYKLHLLHNGVWQHWQEVEVK